MTSIPIAKAVWRLAVVWLIGAATIFLVLLIQWMSGVYKDAEVPQVLSWYTKQVVPTLSLIVTAAVKQLMVGDPDTSSPIDTRIFYLSVAVSAFYLGLAIVAPLTWRFVEQNPVSVLETFTLYLAMLQSLVGVALGVFFLPTPKGAARIAPTS